MANTVVIIERTGPRSSGIVPHDLEVDGRIVISDVSYLDARKLAINYIKPDTVVIERYEITGEEVESIGDLCGGRMKELGEI